MKSKFLSNFALANKYFKSLPDGSRVFFAAFPWSASFIIPDDFIEERLFKKTLLANSFLFILMIFIFFGFWVFKEFTNVYSGPILYFLFFLLAGAIRWVLYRNDLRNLQKIDFTSANSSFYTRLSEGLRSNSNNLFPNYEISTLLEIPNTREKIVMLKHSATFPNVFRCRLDGSIVWQAELPTPSNDVYTNIEWNDGKLHAFSQSCLSVSIDENTGKILSGK